MLKRMVGIELRKALKNKLFYITILLGCSITVLSFVNSISIYQDQLLMQERSAGNPMQALSNVFNNWIGGEAFSLGSSIYFFMLPLLVAIPYGWSYCEEKQCGYVRMAAARGGKTRYYLSKYVAVFLSGGLGAVLPLLFNFLLTSLFIPATLPTPVYCTSNGVFFPSLMSSLYYTMPVLYVLLYLCVDFVFCGLIACISYCAASLIRHRVVVVILPMFLLLAYHYSRQFIYTSSAIRYKEISPLYFLRPVAVSYTASWAVILAEAAVLFIATMFVSMVWERKHEIY